MKSIKAIFRRGQKFDGQNLDNLSRTSSSTTLDSDQRSSKGARSKKDSSRERVDKVAEKKVLVSNKIDTEDDSYPSIDSIQEEEFNHLRRQLQEMSQERANLALQLAEQKSQLKQLQSEIQTLKLSQEDSNVQIEHLTEENTTLRNRLRDVVHSPLSDNEKQQLLFESQRYHSSAPSSIAVNVTNDTNGINQDITTYMSASSEWDKHSSSNASEVSVACLQDKINQMQETHYSTNEELQATLQELTDLQRQITELQQENERLNDEKTLMFDSLCRQTERLNDSRSKVESLKQLLYQEKEDEEHFGQAEQEQNLVDLLKSVQEEREELLLKIEQVNADLQLAQNRLTEKDQQIMTLQERVKTLECSLDAKQAEQKVLEQDLVEARHQCNSKQIEINRLTDLLDSARTKITELEQDRTLIDKSELDELLDLSRKEKDSLESEVAHLKEQLALNKNEIEKLKEQVYTLQEECKVTRNNARTIQSDLEYKLEKLQNEKTTLNSQIQEYQEALNELQVQSQCQLEDKRQLSTVLSETQRNLSEAERKNLNLLTEIEELKKLRAEENEEWEKFQNDLLTSVRVANDFKTEAQQELQRMILENKTFRDRERQLRAEIEKLKKSHQGGKVQLKSIIGKREERKSFQEKTVKSKPDLIPVKNSSMRKSLGVKPANERQSVKDSLTKKQQNKNQVKKREKLFSHKTENVENNTKVKQIPVEKVDGDEKKVKKPVVSKRKIDANKKPDKVTSKSNEKPQLNADLEKPKISNELDQKESKLAKRKRKSLSAEEQMLLKHLEESYEIIDKTIPENKFTESEKAIITLKQLFEDENLKLKPVAKKPKEQLAISKPSLDSVMNNPKLKAIIHDPNVQTSGNVQITDLDADEPDNDPVIPMLRRNLYRSKEVDDLTKDLSLTVKKSRSFSSLSSFSSTMDKNLSPIQKSSISISLPLLNLPEGNILNRNTVGDSREAEKKVYKSYSDIKFTFHKVSSSSSDSMSGAEFNLDTGLTGPYSSIIFVNTKFANLSTDAVDGNALSGQRVLLRSVSSTLKDDLIYNDTLVKTKPKRTSDNFEKDETVVECKNDNITLQSDVKLENKTNADVELDKNEPENVTSVIDPIDESSMHLFEEDSSDESEEYGYKHILRENRYGVTSPLNLRLSFKDVVKEIKYKFRDTKSWSFRRTVTNFQTAENFDKFNENIYPAVDVTDSVEKHEDYDPILNVDEVALTVKNEQHDIPDTTLDNDVQEENIVNVEDIPILPPPGFEDTDKSVSDELNEPETKPDEIKTSKRRRRRTRDSDINRDLGSLLDLLAAENIQPKVNPETDNPKVVEVYEKVKHDRNEENHGEPLSFNSDNSQLALEEILPTFMAIHSNVGHKQEHFEICEQITLTDGIEIKVGDETVPEEIDSRIYVALEESVQTLTVTYPDVVEETLKIVEETEHDEIPMETSEVSSKMDYVVLEETVPTFNAKRLEFHEENADMTEEKDLLGMVSEKELYNEEVPDTSNILSIEEENGALEVSEETTLTIHDATFLKPSGATSLTSDINSAKDSQTCKTPREYTNEENVVVKQEMPDTSKILSIEEENGALEVSEETTLTIHDAIFLKPSGATSLTSEINSTKDSQTSKTPEEHINEENLMVKQEMPDTPNVLPLEEENITPEVPEEVTLRNRDAALFRSPRVTLMTSENIPVDKNPPRTSTLLNRSSRDSSDFTFKTQHLNQRQSYPTIDRVLLRKNQKVKEFAKHFEKLSVEKIKRREVMKKPVVSPRLKRPANDNN